MAGTQAESARYGHVIRRDRAGEEGDCATSPFCMVFVAKAPAQQYTAKSRLSETTSASQLYTHGTLRHPDVVLGPCGFLIYFSNADAAVVPSFPAVVTRNVSIGSMDGYVGCIDCA